MDGREICCCGSRKLTIVIGWAQIVVSIAAIVGVTFLLIQQLVLYLSSEAEANENEGIVPINTGILPSSPVILTSASVVLLIFAVLSLAMAVYLLLGSYRKSIGKIQSWIVCTTISIVIIIWTVVTFIISCFLQTPASGPIFIAIFLVIVLAIQASCLWVANTHRNSIKAEKECESLNALELS